MAALPDIVLILLYALLPALGSAIGVGLAEWKQPPDWLTGAALHAAAGLATAVAAIELIPRAQDRIGSWLLALGVLAGALVALGIARGTTRLQKRLTDGNGKQSRATLWTAYSAIMVDLLIDGLTTGSGGAISSGLGLLLGLSQVVANIPGGFAVTANFRSNGISRKQRLRLVLAYPFTPVLGALAGYLVLSGAGETVRGFALALFAGLLLVATIEDMIPEADRAGAPRKISSPAFAGGFVILLLMSAYLGV